MLIKCLSLASKFHKNEINHKMNHLFALRLWPNLLNRLVVVSSQSSNATDTNQCKCKKINPNFFSFFWANMSFFLLNFIKSIKIKTEGGKLIYIYSYCRWIINLYWFCCQVEILPHIFVQFIMSQRPLNQWTNNRIATVFVCLYKYFDMVAIN